VKPSLAAAAGLYLHAQQNAPLSPLHIQNHGTKFQDLDPVDFWSGLFSVRPEAKADWASGSYLVGPDGSLTLSHYHYDSSD
jgi:hypothetical protein